MIRGDRQEWVGGWMGKEKGGLRVCYSDKYCKKPICEGKLQTKHSATH